VLGPGERRWSFEAIGTQWQIDAERDLTADEQGTVTELIDRYDATWSRFRDDAAITALRDGGTALLPVDQAEPLLDLYRRLARLTDDAVSPLVGASLEHLGYDRGYSFLAAGGHRSAPRMSELRWEPPELTAPSGTVLDVGAAGKGQVAGLVADLLSGLGLGIFTVDAGGDIVRRGPTIRVGLEHPADPTRVVGIAELAGASIAASAINRRWWGEGLHHVIDGRTGAPITSLWATWVIAADPMVADGVATALFFVPPDVVEAEFDIDWVTLGPAGLAASSSWPGEIYR
jgi:thiamine biosynthesis lipoprotein